LSFGGVSSCTAYQATETMTNDIMILGLALIGLAGLLTAIFFVLVPSKKKVKEDAPQVGTSKAAKESRETLRRRRGAAKGTERNDDDGNEGTTEDQVEEKSTGKAKSKKAKKAQKRKEKKILREEKRAAEEEQKDTRSAKDLKYQKKLEERENERQRKEKALAEAMRKKEEKEQAEYEAMKSMFEVEESGTTVDEASSKDTSNLLQKFVDYIHQRKVVVLEDVAAEFRMRSKELLSRIEALELMGRVSGVVDDRGKFIVITKEEMAKVADFINERGRISLSDLAIQSNFLVDLEPKVGAGSTLEDDDDDGAAASTGQPLPDATDSRISGQSPL